MTKEEYDDAEARLKEVLSRLNATRMDGPDAQLIAGEIRNGAAMLLLACHHGRWRLGVEKMPAEALKNMA